MRDGVGLYVTGMGKVNAALSVTALLNDGRFDFSDAYVLSTGCAGSAVDYTVMGDVVIVTAAIDYDLGHHADPREETHHETVTWFHAPDYDSSSFRLLDQDLADKVYRLVRDIPLETTDKTRACMSAAFDGTDSPQRVFKSSTAPSVRGSTGSRDPATPLPRSRTPRE